MTLLTSHVTLGKSRTLQTSVSSRVKGWRVDWRSSALCGLDGLQYSGKASQRRLALRGVNIRITSKRKEWGHLTLAQGKSKAVWAETHELNSWVGMFKSLAGRVWGSGLYWLCPWMSISYFILWSRQWGLGFFYINDSLGRLRGPASMEISLEILETWIKMVIMKP